MPGESREALFRMRQLTWSLRTPPLSKRKNPWSGKMVKSKPIKIRESLGSSKITTINPGRLPRNMILGFLWSQNWSRRYGRFYGNAPKKFGTIAPIASIDSEIFRTIVAIGTTWTFVGKQGFWHKMETKCLAKNRIKYRLHFYAQCFRIWRLQNIKGEVNKIKKMFF